MALVEPEALPDVDALVEEIHRAALDADDAALRAARGLDLIDRTKSQREAGHALLGDLASRLGLSPQRARALLDLGRALRRYPGLEEAIRSRKIGLEKAVVAAAAMAESPVELGVWVKEIRARSMEALRAYVRRERSSRVVDGERVQRESLELSAEGRAMLFDAVARMSRLRVLDGHPEAQATLGRTDVIGKAVDLALRKLREGAPVGERRYRIAEHAPGTLDVVRGLVGDEFVLLRAERAAFRLEVSPPENVEEAMARLRARHGVQDGDTLALAERALASGLYLTETRPLAFALSEDLKRSISSEKEAWHRVARTMVVLDELRVPDWREWVADEIDRSRSVVSELLSCGRAAKRFPAIGEALATGRTTWTHVRTLAPYLDEENFETLYPLILECSVRELESLRGGLARSGGRTARGRISGAGSLPPIELEMSCVRWNQVEDLARLLGKRLGRRGGRAEAIEEALWQALLAWGAPSPLWEAYRIVVHHDRGTDASWFVVPGGIVPVSPHELSRLRGLDTVVYDIEQEFEEAKRRELDRLARSIEGSLSEDEVALERLRASFARPGRAPDPEVALRRLIYLRDGARCSVCGCHAALYVHVHHVDPRAEGGGNDPANLTLLCTRCHALTHSNFGRLVPRASGNARIFAVAAWRGGDEGRSRWRLASFRVGDPVLN